MLTSRPGLLQRSPDKAANSLYLQLNKRLHRARSNREVIPYLASISFK